VPSLFQRLRTYFNHEDLVTITPSMYKAKVDQRREMAVALARAEEHKRLLELNPKPEVVPRIPKDQFIGPIPQRRHSDHLKIDPPLPDHTQPLTLKFKSAPVMYHTPSERETD